MIKRTVSFFILLLAIYIILSGCVGKSNAELTTSMGTSGSGGSLHPVALKIAEVVRKYTNVNISIEETGGNTENILRMRNGEIGMGMINSAMAYYAYHGEQAFINGVYKDMRIVVNLFPTVVQVVVLEDSPIKSYADFKGNIFSPGSWGSGDELLYMEIFTLYGINEKDIYWRPLSHFGRALALKEKSVQAAGYFTSLPSVSILEISSKDEIRLIGIEDKKEIFFKKYPYYVPWVIPANTYSGQTEEVESIASGTFICADVSVSDELIYNFLKGMFSELDAIRNVHNMSKFITFESSLDAVGDMPIHSGAEKYFLEKGLIK